MKCKYCGYVVGVKQVCLKPQCFIAAVYETKKIEEGICPKCNKRGLK